MQTDPAWLFKRLLIEVVEHESCGGWLGTGKKLDGESGLRADGLVKYWLACGAGDFGHKRNRSHWKLKQNTRKLSENTEQQDLLPQPGATQSGNG